MKKVESKDLRRRKTMKIEKRNKSEGGGGGGGGKRSYIEGEKTQKN